MLEREEFDIAECRWHQSLQLVRRGLINANCRHSDRRCPVIFRLFVHLCAFGCPAFPCPAICAGACVGVSQIDSTIIVFIKGSGCGMTLGVSAG